MTTRKTPRTAQIKPATRNAIMDQLALAADEQILTRQALQAAFEQLAAAGDELAAQKVRSGNALAYALRHIEFLQQRRWWHRFAWWRA